MDFHEINDSKIDSIAMLRIILNLDAIIDDTLTRFHCVLFYLHEISRNGDFLGCSLSIEFCSHLTKLLPLCFTHNIF